MQSGSLEWSRLSRNRWRKHNVRYFRVDPPPINHPRSLGEEAPFDRRVSNLRSPIRRASEIDPVTLITLCGIRWSFRQNQKTIIVVLICFLGYYIVAIESRSDATGKAYPTYHQQSLLQAEPLPITWLQPSCLDLKVCPSFLQSDG